MTRLISSTSPGIVGVQPPEVIERTQKCVSDKLLYRCLTCDALMEYHLSMEQFEKGGALYNLAVNTHKKLDPTKMYSFPTYGKMFFSVVLARHVHYIFGA